ncbi:MAG: CoA transferase [Desulfobacteraceae bacterium]|nr:CoA transferase [Desulfobacteraceae bacterium]
MSKNTLDGIKVVEYATEVSGPYCGKLLADLGAEVIKIEPPGGDPSRSFGPFPKSGPHPEKSATFLYLNTSKKGVVLDLDTVEGLADFKKLLQWADLLIDNHPPRILEGLGLSWDTLHALNPGLVYTSITPYGRTGPRANIKGDELTLIHAGGLGNLLPTRSIDVDRAPVKIGGYPVGYHGGIVAALASLAAVIGKMRTGLGQLIDISLQEVILAMVSPTVASTRYHKTTWCRVPDRPPPMGRMKTKDGYVILNAFDNHHFKALRDLMGNPEWLEGDEWLSLAYRAHHLMDVALNLDEWMLNQKKDNIHHKAAKMGIPIGPIATAQEVMNNKQYAAREYFLEVEHPEAGKYRYPGWPYKMSSTPPRVSRPAPLLGQYNEEVFLNLNSSTKESKGITAPQSTKAATGKSPKDNTLPLDGIRILEFCMVWAGPYANMLLTHLGAEVIRVETHKRTDLTRRSFPWPLPDPAPTEVPPNQGLAYNSVNQGKKSVTLDLTNPEGLELAKRLVGLSDVVVDNLRPGAMDKLSLGYEDLRQIKPNIIVLSTSSRGHAGPERNYRGFAMIHQAIGGQAYITGYPDDHPCHSTGDVDLMNATTAAYAVITALYHQSRTGEGQFIDYSQCEGESSLIGEILLGYEMTSIIPERMGNAHPTYAPHNVYRCWGVDRWLALEIHSDEEFAILARVIGKPALAKDPRFADMASRKGYEAELDQIIEEWTGQRDRDWMVGEFCMAGLAASPSRDARDLYADPHLKARKAFVTINHPELGELELVGMPWKMSDLEMPRNHAPLLGQHNQYVLNEILGLSDIEIANLRKKDIIM